MDEFEALRREPDPVARGRRATDLLAMYQQRTVELSRLRRAAIEEARTQLGGSYTDVARAFGLTKGRITQIRSAAPPAHRAFYGVGPLTLALPGRRLFERDDVVIATEDDAVGARMTAEVEELAFLVERTVLDPKEEWEPEGDAIVVCGPSSAHIGQKLMADDPRLGMALGDGARWAIVDKATGERYESPMDDAEPRRADVAYIARHKEADDSVIVHVASVHALGSVGAAHYLASNVPALWADPGDCSFSMVVAGEFDGLTPVEVSVVVPPQEW